MAKNPLQLVTPTLKPRDEAFNQKMNQYHLNRKGLLDANKYLEPEWNELRDEMQQFRSGYEKPKLYSAREYMLDNDPDEFQIDQIRDDIDFKGLWDEMQKGKDFYEIASVDGKGFDSAVREKLFNGMANELGLDYDDIYYKWLGKEKPSNVAKTPYQLDNGNKANKNYVSKFKAKYPDRYAKLKQNPIGNNLSDEEIDEFARDLGVALD